MRQLAMHVFVIIMFSFSSVVFAGSLDSPDDPSQGSQMYSIDNLYNRLDTGATVSIPASFTEPTTAPGSTGHSLADVMAIAPTLDSPTGATPQNVLALTYFWGLRIGGGWGLLMGEMPNIGRQIITPGISPQGISEGYHNGTGYVVGDTDLTSANISQGVNIFNVVGTAVVAGGSIVDTTSGDATPADIVTGRVAWTDGAPITGTNGSCVECAGTLSALGRWCDNGDGTVTDMTSGLVWLQNAGWGGNLSWDGNNNVNANVRAGSLYAGSPGANLNDASVVGEWRLPSKSEIVALISGTEPVSYNYPQYFTDVADSWYWTSTGHDEVNSTFAWGGSLGHHAVVDIYEKSLLLYVLPVRERR